MLAYENQIKFAESARSDHYAISRDNFFKAKGFGHIKNGCVTPTLCNIKCIKCSWINKKTNFNRLPSFGCQLSHIAEKVCGNRVKTYLVCKPRAFCRL